MIQIIGISPEQISLLPLTPYEKAIVAKKENSLVVYDYDSLAALEFEMKTRTRIVEAARALSVSGVDFADFKNTRANERFWTVTEEGGFRLRDDVLPSDAINDIFFNGKLYAFECSGAIIIIMYKAVLDTIGAQAFNTYFRNLYVWGWNYDRDLPLRRIESNRNAYPGDVLYFNNPDFDPETPEWRGENVVMLADDLYFGHGIGITTSRGMIETLNRARRPFSHTSAYLLDEKIQLGFEELRRLYMRLGLSIYVAPYRTTPAAI